MNDERKITRSMMGKISVHKWESPQTRPCSFSLCIQDSCVFADFDIDETSKQISLCRISFDSYGCCNVEQKTTMMSTDDSKVLLDAIANEQQQLLTPIVDDILRRYFRANASVIWEDALVYYKLL